MSRRAKLGLLVAVLALGVAAAGVGGFLLYKKERRQPAADSAKSVYDTGFSAWNWTIHLRPLRAEQVGDAKVEQMWRDLFPAMAKDPRTRDLLQQLHGGLPVEFVVVDAEMAKGRSALEGPPSEGYAIAMRATDFHSDKWKTPIGELPFKLIAYGRKHHLSDVTWPTSTDLISGEPQPAGALTLAMEDYVCRHAPGWVLGGPHFDADQKLPANAEEQRAELDERIRAYAEHAKEFYGRLRQP